MGRRNILCLLAGGAILAGSVYAWQREFREYPGYEYSDFALPGDYKKPGEVGVRPPDAIRRLPRRDFVRGDPRKLGSRPIPVGPRIILARTAIS